MIAAVLLLLAQDVPAQDGPIDDEGEVVVQATFGRTTMLFDKASDGRLHNCRVMVSSGSQRRDTAACQATPVCYAKTAEQVPDCVPLTAVEPAAAPKAIGHSPATFEMPRLAQPRTPDPAAIGPSVVGDESRETIRQRVKLPPLPKPPSDGPIVRVTSGDSR
jgi:hypothetical protein